MLMMILVQLRRYLTVGVAAALTDFCLYGILTRFGSIAPVIANLISRPVGGLVSFAGNKLWTFERRSLAGTPTQLLRFALTWLAAYGVSEALVWFFHNRIGLGPLLAKLCAEAIACGGIFLTHRFWTFRTRG